MHKSSSYVAPCTVKQPKKSMNVSFGLVFGGAIVAIGGIGNGTSDLNIWVMIAGLIISGWGALRIVRP